MFLLAYLMCLIVYFVLWIWLLLIEFISVNVPLIQNQIKFYNVFLRAVIFSFLDGTLQPYLKKLG